MCLSDLIKRWRKRRRDRIYEGPCEDGGTRISNDTNAPKEIISRELIRFSCRFCSISLIDETRILGGMYHFSADKTEDGVSMSVKCNNPRVLDGELTKIRPDSFMKKLEAILRKYDVAQYNGKYYKVSGLPNFYGASVDAEYASGETLYCYNNQDPFLPVEMILELCSLFGIDKK